jgi:hypothetical protein
MILNECAFCPRLKSSREISGTLTTVVVAVAASGGMFQLLAMRRSAKGIFF